MKLKTMKSSCLVAATLIFSIFISSAFADARIIRGDINIDDGPNISFSAPVGLLQALKTSGISAMVVGCKNSSEHKILSQTRIHSD